MTSAGIGRPPIPNPRVPDFDAPRSMYITSLYMPHGPLPISAEPMQHTLEVLEDGACVDVDAGTGTDDRKFVEPPMSGKYP